MRHAPRRNAPHAAGHHGIAGTLTALNFAKQVAAHPDCIHCQDVERLHRAGYSDREIEEIISTVTVERRQAVPPGRRL